MCLSIVVIIRSLTKELHEVLQAHLLAFGSTWRRWRESATIQVSALSLERTFAKGRLAEILFALLQSPDPLVD